MLDFKDLPLQPPTHYLCLPLSITFTNKHTSQYIFAQSFYTKSWRSLSLCLLWYLPIDCVCKHDSTTGGVVPACHTLWLPALLKCSVHISSSAWLPSPPRRRLRAVGCPFSGPGCRGKRSDEPHSPTTGILVEIQQLRSKVLYDMLNIFSKCGHFLMGGW